MKAKIPFLFLVILFVSFFQLSERENLVYASTTAQAVGDSHIYLPMIQNGNPVSLQGEPGSCLTAEEAKLASLINDYRTLNGLPNAPLSKSLTAVAQWHVKDLVLNHPVTSVCNMHSWSDKGFWSPVCYTSNHSNAEGMWIKPKEVSRGVYTGDGYEIAYWTSTNNAQAADALNAWKNSSGHNNVILERDIWDNFDWQAMGVGIYQGYAVAWFSYLFDPAGTISPCN